ncbi:MAG TPA: ester cyclase [Streptosporangiaceae bacterium]|nr:ester cyclase [Streptosporangiaceae bacterium]
MTADQNAEIMRRYLTEVVGAGNLSLLDELAAEDMVDHTAVAAGWGTGRQGLLKHVRYFRETLPDLEVTVDRLIASADEVVGIWRVAGTHRGFLFGFPATGRRLEWSNASIFTIADGRIAGYSGVWGALEAVQGMGVLPAAS